MDEAHQGVLFYQALVPHEMIEEDPVMGQEASPGVRPEEYMETDYEFGDPMRSWKRMGMLMKSPMSLPLQR